MNPTNPTPGALLLTKTVQSILPETDVHFQQMDGATVVIWAEYTSKRTLMDAKRFNDRLLKGMRKNFLQAIPTVKKGKSGIEVFVTTLHVANLERIEARLVETSAPTVKWIKVGDLSWDDKQAVYAVNDGMCVIVVPTAAGYSGYLLSYTQKESAILSWAKGRTKLLSLTKDSASRERKSYKEGVTQARVQELAATWLIEESAPTKPVKKVK